MLHSAVAGFVTRLECLLPCGGGHVEHILVPIPLNSSDRMHEEKRERNRFQKSCTRAFGDGPRNFEPWSSDVDDTWAGNPSPNYHNGLKMWNSDSLYHILTLYIIKTPSFLNRLTAQGWPKPSQEVFSRPAFFLPVFFNS
ncbi:hypothetical protein TNCV_2822991 [Trichonephila clavipes]|nr:hypothetical protein TNCV_2822991 [Trichonephila clavipes]